MVRKNKTWGDEGFTTIIKYGAYDYTVKFVSEQTIREYIKSEDENLSVFGGVNCFDQMILIRADTTDQTQKVTLLHELVHAVLLRNGNSQDTETKDINSEELVDGIALGMYELIRRNPEMTRWLSR